MRVCSYHELFWVCYWFLQCLLHEPPLAHFHHARHRHVAIIAHTTHFASWNVWVRGYTGRTKKGEERGESKSRCARRVLGCLFRGVSVCAACVQHVCGEWGVHTSKILNSHNSIRVMRKQNVLRAKNLLLPLGEPIVLHSDCEFCEKQNNH